MTKQKKPPKILKSFLLPTDLAEWVKAYAKSNNTTMTQILVDHLTELRQKAESGYVEQV